MKDYLNSREKDEFITFCKALDNGSLIENLWDERGNLTKEERKALRTLITWGRKFIKSLMGRLNQQSKESIHRHLKSSSVVLNYKGEVNLLLKKRCCEIEAGYEENRDYFKLIELLMHYNCRECDTKCSDCAIYTEFEEKNVPEFMDNKDNGKCKYSYINL